MKLLDWLIALVLILMGVGCLTMSASWMMEQGSLLHYLNNFFSVCMWIGIPLIITAIVYLIIKSKKGERK
ncbi:hypothetical protein [Paenibacillus sp. Soil787]|uniref:hypothetical protein n=1 Tax=Paenibacillus sp. Soil787 TaxID=1736411 RepID=UPI0007032C9B|nr:hypothetical protein [Paenibacillus sp. Soil787]KRF18631.1 hypothetical protein ASG93_11370 [Paenibacillus sp. Soil787]